MNEVLGSVLWLIVSLGILITFHELGHYWVARRCGVRVLRFSVGFGAALWSRTDRNGVEWRIGMIPLGGYVSMLDEREADVPVADRAAAFNNRPVGQRIAIVAAGPIANAVLAVALLYVMFVIGKPDFIPFIAEPEGIAAESGFQSGDRLLSVDGRDTPTWTEATQALLAPMIDRRNVAVSVMTDAGATVDRRLELSRIDPGLKEEDGFAAIGLRGRTPVLPAVVGGVEPGSPADGVLEPGDRLVSLEGERLASFDDLAAALARASERPLNLSVSRGQERLELSITPKPMTLDDGRTLLRLGIRAIDPRDAMLRYGPIEAAPQAFKAAGQLASDTVGMLGRMLTGAASLDNLSGPITIAQAANNTAARGVAWFLYFLAMLSVSLAILNLLPIPVLDGGHLLYYLIELVTGRPLGDRVLMAGQYLGLVLLVSLMGLALFNDVLRLVP